MARWTEDLVFALELLAAEDGIDWTSPPVPLLASEEASGLRVVYFTDNGIAPCSIPVRETVSTAAPHLASVGARVEERRPPGIEQSYELEMSLLGADGGDGIDSYLQMIGSDRVHPLLTNFVERFRRFRGSAARLASYWAEWDAFRTNMLKFFGGYDVVICPVYTQPALEHGASMQESNFDGFSYTMTWSVAWFPAATVRCGQTDGLPINVQVVARPWRELTALAVCRELEQALGGWTRPLP
jgi:amidase